MSLDVYQPNICCCQRMPVSMAASSAPLASFLTLRKHIWTDLSQNLHAILKPAIAYLVSESPSQLDVALAYQKSAESKTMLGQSWSALHPKTLAVQLQEGSDARIVLKSLVWRQMYSPSVGGIDKGQKGPDKKSLFLKCVK